jgi:hypothetical protein
METATNHMRNIIRAELKGDDIALACGFVIRSSSPLLALCRKLIDAGYDPSTPLAAYRGDTLCLKVQSIGEAAGLEVNARGTSFKRQRTVRAAPPTRQTKVA